MTVALDVNMQQAIDDPSTEPVFLRALLNAQLFVHCLQGGDADRLRIVQFNRPDGLQVIPAFTDLHKAVAASSPYVEIKGLNGRMLFEATRGATFMLNPNDTSCTLYPEEISHLLSGRRVARAPLAGSAEGMDVGVADEDDLWIGRLAAEALEPILPATVLYQLEAYREDFVDAPTVLLLIGVPERYGERVARAIGARLEADAARLSSAVDLTHFDPNGALPDWITALAVKPVWRRRNVH